MAIPSKSGLFENSFTKEEISLVVLDYKSVITRVNNPRKSFPIQMELSYILAYYAGEESEALSILESLILNPGLTDMQKAQIKMKIADIDVLKGEIWDASILYMQIDTDFKYELIGNEAKYKNARVFYFDGEFDYAQSQLNILKESNDGFYISEEDMKIRGFGDILGFKQSGIKNFKLADPVHNSDLFLLAEKEIRRIENENEDISRFKPLIKLYDRADIINDIA